MFSSSSSSSSSSSHITRRIKYDVFLSFRGEDTRYNFTSHLHKALRDKHIETFIDYKLNRGDEISPSLLQAIQESQISIIIFSKNYATSRWCLEELIAILECKKKYKQMVIPVFYEVDPSDVRNQKGSFADAFTKHEERFKDNLDRVQTWKNALKEAADLSGSDSHVNKPDSVLIENIVEDVLERLNDDMSSTDDPIGIDSRIIELEMLVDIGGSKDVRSVGIWGIGGIGKTTLAASLFNKISHHFEAYYFTDNVRDASVQSGGLNDLRRQLISAILGDETGNIGSSFTKKRLGRTRLMVVFEDVTDFRQIEYLIGGFDHLGSGSRIIITSRDKQVLESCRVNRMYKVEELHHGDALQLFCRHGFGQNKAPVDYEKLSERLVKYGGGVPLVLKQLGCTLFGKETQVWESQINKLEKTTHVSLQLEC